MPHSHLKCGVREPLSSILRTLCRRRRRRRKAAFIQPDPLALSRSATREHNWQCVFMNKMIQRFLLQIRSPAQWPTCPNSNELQTPGRIVLGGNWSNETLWVMWEAAVVKEWVPVSYGLRFPFQCSWRRSERIGRLLNNQTVIILCGSVIFYTCSSIKVEAYTKYGNC